MNKPRPNTGKKRPTNPYQKITPKSNVSKYVRPHTAAKLSQSKSQEIDESSNNNRRPKTAGVLKSRKKIDERRLKNKYLPDNKHNDSGFTRSEDNIENVGFGDADKNSYKSSTIDQNDNISISMPSEGYASTRSSMRLSEFDAQETNNAIDRCVLLSLQGKTVALDERESLFHGKDEFNLENEKDRYLYKLRFQDIAGAPTTLPLSMIGKRVRVRRPKNAWMDREENIVQALETESLNMRQYLNTQKKWQRLMMSIRAFSSEMLDLQDSDLEMDFIKPVETDFDGTGLSVYKRECKRRNSVPVSYLLRHIGDRSIHMKHHYMNSDTVKAIACALLVNTVTEQIDFSDNFIEDEGVKYIAEMLTINLFIVDLDISNNSIKSEGVEALTGMLLVNKSIKSLNLSGNKLVCKDMTCFIEVAKVNTTLQTLDLSNNSIGEYGGQLLGSVISASESLHNLDLSWNGIRRKGATSVMSALCKNDRLEVLDLSWNGLASCGADALGKSLKLNVALKVIDLSHNNINDDGADKIAGGIKKNVTLQTIILSQNSIGEKGCLTLLKSCETHPRIKVIAIEEMKLTIAVLEKIPELEESRFYVLNSGLNEYRCFSPQVGMCHLFCKMVRRQRDDLMSRFSEYDKSKTGVISRDQLCVAIMDSGVLLTNKLLRTLMDEVDSHMTDEIRYHDIFSLKPSKTCRLSLRLKQDLFPAVPVPTRKLIKALTFG